MSPRFLSRSGFSRKSVAVRPITCTTAELVAVASEFAISFGFTFRHLLRLHVVLVPQLYFHQLAGAKRIFQSADESWRESVLSNMHRWIEMVRFGAKLRPLLALQFLILPGLVMKVRTSIGVPFQ